MVRVGCIFGLILLTAVVLMVSGFGLVAVAVAKLTHDVDVIALFNSVQVNGVIVDGKIGRTIIRYDVDSMSLSSWKLKMKLAGDDYVFGEAIIGPVGIIA